MSGKKVFISHIHEEMDIAILIKKALEDEFSGFVDVFVSSDGVSIPTGTNFLNKIENNLMECIAAIFILSKKSLPRNWINFELGAIWIRNSISINSGGSEIPAVPMCHSGASPANLPSPLNNLNAVLASQSSHLERVFRDIQRVAGGRGALKTDFDELAREISYLESRYLYGERFAEIFSLLGADVKSLKSILWSIENKPGKLGIKFDSIRDEKFNKAKNISIEIGEKIATIRRLKSHIIHNGLEQYNASSGIFEVDPSILIDHRDNIVKCFGEVQN